MKKITKLAAAALFAFSFSLSTAYAQAPEKMSYQAVIRNASNALVQSQGIGVQITILKGGASGTPVYVETHNVTTNTNGLVSLEIGAGTVVSGDFTTIDWGADTYFIQTETDPTTAGGSNYTITGTTQLMSVPYALHAKTADNFTGTITETDPVFGASVASGITAADTANWNNNVDTQIDSVGINALGYVAGPHTVDTDTHIDSTGIAALGFNAGGITTEIDGDPTNEIQVLSKSGSMVSLSNGGGNFIDAVNDADNDPLNELQTLSKTLDIVTLSNTGGSFSVNDADSDPLNELQDISLSGNNLSLTNGSTVNLSGVGFDGNFNNLTNVPANLDTDYTDDFDGQYSSLTGAPTNVSAFTNDAGYLTTEVDASIFNEIQTISRTGTIVTLSNGGGSFTDSVNTYTAGTGIAISAGNVISASPGSALAIGDSYQGGIIFWLDVSGQHGLIAAAADQGTGMQWYNGIYKITGATGDGLYAGTMNSAIIVATQMADNQTGNFAAKICADYSVVVGGITYGDWYLPSKYELNLLYLQRTVVGGFALSYYWSSTEGSSNTAWTTHFNSTLLSNFIPKFRNYRVRAVRAF